MIEKCVEGVKGVYKMLYLARYVVLEAHRVEEGRVTRGQWTCSDWDDSDASEIDELVESGRRRKTGRPWPRLYQAIGRSTRLVGANRGGGIVAETRPVSTTTPHSGV